MYFDSHGDLLYYERVGDGKPLLLLHGWGCRGNIFSALINDFAPRMRVYFVDFPGHGNSPEPRTAWSVSEYMEQIHAFIQHAQIQGTDIIAHSFGGRVAILLAATYPEDVGKIVLTGAAGLRAKPAKKRTVKQRVYRVLRNIVDNGLTRKLCPKAAAKLKESLIMRFGSPDYRALSPNMRGTFNRVILQDLGGYLPKISAPTLLIWGEDDTETPLWMGERMEKEIPDAALIRFSGAGHFAFAEKYAQFRNIVENFLLG